MFDKLSICNTALIRTGNNPAQFEGDGSDEWISASDAYDSELPLLLAEHNWGFALDSAELQREGNSGDPQFTDAFYKPAGNLHVSQVWLAGSPIVYGIHRNLIVCNAGTVTPVAKYVMQPSADQWPQHFLEVLRLRIMSHLYRGLNEDTGEADKVYAGSNAMLELARSRTDAESPGRAMVNSNLLRARRRRRLGGYSNGYSGGN